MKKYLLPAVALLVFINVSHAQLTTNTTLLREASVQMKTAQEANYKAALVLAKQKGWDSTIKGVNGDAHLVGTNFDGSPKYYTTFNNTTAAATTGTNHLWNGGSSGLNLSGSSLNMKNKLGIWDEGRPLLTHVELTGRITMKDSTTGVRSHTTHVTGTLLASGVNPIAKGMSYGLQGMIAYDFFNDLSEIGTEAPNLLLSNHSYGQTCGWLLNTNLARWEYYGRGTDTADYKFGYYDAEAQWLDNVAYNAPNYLIVKAAGNYRDKNGPAVGQPYYRYNDTTQTIVFAGNRPAGISNNDGYDIMATSCGSKNVLTVGAVFGIAAGYTQKEDVVMSSFSCWGPTDDGRIKPDLVADGINVTSCASTGNSDYRTTNGTSSAAPNVSGSLLLLQEYYSQKKAGAFMRSATLKGLAIHTAEESGDAPGPDYKFGWGLLNVRKAAEVITEFTTTNNVSGRHRIYENILTNGNSFTVNMVPFFNGKLVATLCWTDPFGNVETVNVFNNPTKKLVNDLDIKITKGATTYMPWILDPLVPSAAATKGNNTRDNVERINVDSVSAVDTYTITVSHKGVLSAAQAYTLIISSIDGGILPVTLTSFTGSVKENKVLLHWNTATETNNKGWDIEKMVVGNNNVAWQKIGFIEGKGNGANDYSFLDNDVKPGTTIQYRLRQIDVDGRFTYSKIISVAINGQLKLSVSTYPNPLESSTKISYTTPQKGKVNLAVYSLTGKLVATLVNEEKEAGAYLQHYSTGSLAAGSYVLKLTNNGTTVHTIINKL